MEQGDLFAFSGGASPDPGSKAQPTRGPTLPRARALDPPTSKAAAANVHRFDGEHFKAILAVLRAYGPGTIYEIAERTRIIPPHLDHVQVARRCGELERAARIQRNGGTRPSPSGNACAVWQIV